MFGRSFKVELLDPRRLPRQLLPSLSALLASNDSALRQAASGHFQHLADHTDFLQGVDYSATLAELHASVQQDVEEMSADDARRGSFVAWQVQAYEDTSVLLNESFFSLVALGLLASGASREEILVLLNEQSWATKHEILTRWGWMQAHRDLLEKGTPLSAPYLCAVARRGGHGRKVDKEFYQLLSFLHCLRAATGEELLFAEKPTQDPPDFSLKDAHGAWVGAEMTEVSISSTWDTEQDAQDQVLDVISARCQEIPAYVHVRKPGSWVPLTSQLEEIGAWLSSELVRLGRINAEVSLVNAEFGFCVELTPATEPQTWIGCSDPRPRVNTRSKEMRQTLQQRIYNKIFHKKNGQPRKRSSIRPCHLVIYPNHDFDADLDAVIREFLRHPQCDVCSHFDAVWLSSETRLAKLF